MKVIIPCAGRGKGAAPVTQGTPKALYPVNHGKPSLDCILDWVKGMDYSKVFVVVSPDTADLFRLHIANFYADMGIELIEQSEPEGDGDAIRVAFEKADPPFKYSREPLLFVLGDTIPIGPNAGIFQEHLNVEDNKKPPYSRLGLVEGTHHGAFVTVASNKFVKSINELRGDDVKDGLYFNGIAYIKRGDYLYDKLRIIRSAKLKSYGEYRIGSALKEMFHFGESFHGLPMQTLNVGTPSAIRSAISYFYDERKRWEIKSH